MHIQENSQTINIHLKSQPLARWKSNIYFIIQFSLASSPTSASHGTISASLNILIQAANYETLQREYAQDATVVCVTETAVLPSTKPGPS